MASNGNERFTKRLSMRLQPNVAPGVPGGLSVGASAQRSRSRQGSREGSRGGLRGSGASTPEIGMHGAASLLSETMNVATQNLRRSSHIDRGSIPQTSSRIRIPLDSALEELSKSMSEQALYNTSVLSAAGNTSFASGSSFATSDAFWAQATSATPAHRPWTAPDPSATASMTASMRKPAKRPSSRGGGREETPEEQKLNAMLEAKNSSLEREGLGREEMRRHGLKQAHVTRLYRLLYLHSTGLQDILLLLTEHSRVSERGTVLLKVWRVFVWCVEQLMASRASTQLSVALQQSNDTISVMQDQLSDDSATIETLSRDLGAANHLVEELQRRTVALEGDLAHMTRDRDETSSTQRHGHDQAMRTAEMMMARGNEYSEILFSQLNAEREAREAVEAALQHANLAAQAAEEKLVAARQVTQSTDEAGRVERAKRSKVEADQQRTQHALNAREAELQEQKEACAQLQRELNEARAANSELKEDKQGKDEQCDELLARHNKITKDCERFKERLAHEKLRNAKLLQQLDASKSSLTIEEERRQRATEELDVLSVVANKAEGSLATVQSALNTEQTAKALLLQEVQQLREESKESDRKISTLSADLTSAFARLDKAK